MIIQMGRRAKIICILSMLLIGTGWGIGYWLSKTPIYYASHEHGGEKEHHHVHTHRDGDSHGHWHLGFPNITHAHAHHHGHLHDGDFPEDHENLTELGHVHLEEGTYTFWARCDFKTERSVRKLQMTFYAGFGGEVEQIEPSESSVRGKLKASNDQIIDVEFYAVESSLVAQCPQELKQVNDSVVEIDSVKLNGSTFKDAVVVINN